MSSRLAYLIYKRHSRGERERVGGKKLPRNEIGNRVFCDVNSGTSNMETSIPILVGNYRQLQLDFWLSVDERYNSYLSHRIIDTFPRLLELKL